MARRVRSSRCSSSARRTSVAPLALAALSLGLALASCGPTSSDKASSGSLGSNRSASLEPVNTGLAALVADDGSATPQDITPDSTPLMDPSARLAATSTTLPQSDDEKLAASQAAAASLQAAMQDLNQPPTTSTASSSTPQVFVEPVANEPPRSRITTITKQGTKAKQPNTPQGPAMAAPGPIDTTAITPAIEAANDAWSTAKPNDPGTITRQPTPAPASTLLSASQPTNSAVAVAQTSDPLIALATQMANLIRTPSTDPTKDQSAIDAAALAPLEALRPGILLDIDAASSPLATLTAQDRATLAAARDRLASKPGGGGGGSNSDSLRQALSKISPPSNLRIARAALCSRVETFGKFTTLPNDAFVAGRPIRAIVYSELDGFSTRAASENDRPMRGVPLSEQVSVDLQQSLALFQDSTGLQVWTRPPQTVVETSRNKRRDFYLIQQIELPRTLGIGRYNLKITVKDRNSGAESESILPITITAQ